MFQILGLVFFISTNFLFSLSLASDSNGTKSLIGYFPSQVDIKDAATGKHKCSGTLIEDRHVVTSAYCITRSVPSELAVMAGDISLLPNSASTRETRRVLQIVKHPDYVSDDEHGLEYNLAILKLDMPFTRSNYLHPAVIPRSKANYGTPCFLVGWNSDYQLSTADSDLLYSEVLTMEMEQCYKCIGNALCAGSNQNGPCIDDEGGPLMCNGVLHGVYVGSANSCQLITGIYTDVVFYKDWLDQVISWDGKNYAPLPFPNARKRHFRNVIPELTPEIQESVSTSIVASWKLIVIILAIFISN